MAGDDTQNYLFSSASSTRRSSEKRSASSKPDSRSRTSSDTDISSIGGVHYPCFGKVDLASYIAARTYGLNFRRLHDEWVVLGRPAINTSHWPVLAGHRGLPASPENFIAVAEHYEGKIFSQVALDMAGKPADRNRPLDDFIISMVVTAAIVNADFLIHRMLRDEILREEAMVQHVWHRYFTTFLHDAIRHFAHERTVCDRLGTHNCVVPLLYGQACAMTLPTLIQTFDYQVQIFQNLFPNFGDHVTRCAAAQPSQRLDVDAIIAQYITKMDGSARQGTAAGKSASTSGPAGSFGSIQSPYAGTTHPEGGSQAEAGSSRPRLAVTVVPDEVKGRPDLFVADIDSAIRCDVPLEQVLKVIDSNMTVSASSSTASSPPSIAALTSIRAPYHNSSVSPRASFPSSDTDWPLRRHADLSDSAVEEGEADIDSANLMLRPPLQGQAQWPVGIPRRSTSEEHNAITPDEAMAATQTRAHSNSVYSYFSSLPATPTELLSPDGVVSTHEGTQSYMDRRPYRSNSGQLASTSAALESDTRKRTRAEQNREKMKAYHRRVMQQREALTTVLADMSAHVGTIPMLSTRTNAAGLLGIFSGEASGSLGGDGASGSGSASSVGRSAPESSWSVSLRNKQKQESKARLRKREIDQVRELGLYANYANGTLWRPGGGRGGPSASPGASGSGFRGGSGASGTGDVQGGMATAWRQSETAQMGDAEAHMSHAILRVFMRHRPSWIALISAEQRLASEVTKLSPRTEDGASGVDDGSAGDGSGGSGAGKGIKALIDRVQMEERAGTMSMLSPESAHMLSRGMMSGAGVNQPGSLLDASGTSRYASQGSYGASVLLDAGAVVLSPGREYGATASPSGVTRPMGGEESADYFSQERRSMGGRQGDSAAGTQRESGSGHGAMSSMLPAQSGFSYGFYGGEAQARANASSPMGGMAAMSPPPLPMQSRMSMSYDGRGGYGAATATSRVEQSSGLYHTQPIPMQPYAYGQAPSQPAQMPGGGQGLVQQEAQPMTDAMMAYRSNESTASSYATSHHHHHQAQQQQQHQAQQQHSSQTHTQQSPSYGQQGGYHAQ